MGCCGNGRMNAQQEKLLIQKFKEGIEADSHKRISLVLGLINRKQMDKELMLIDKPVIEAGKYKFNCLGYSVFVGSSKVFKLLYESGASLKYMEELFFSQNLRTIIIICEKGYVELLKFYLPLYMRNFRSSIASFRTSTIDFSEFPNTSEYAIHAACRTGMINIVSYLYKYFKDYKYTPAEFSFNTLDESNKDDVGLIACRSGSFLLVKLLHENCGVSFNRVNKYNENAIMACIQGDKTSENFSYMEILTYLIEVVKVNFLHMHEEALLTTENPKIIAYLEEKLESVGIHTKKCNLDKESERTRIVRDSIVSNGLQEAFNMNSFASSIISNESGMETPFSVTSYL